MCSEDRLIDLLSGRTKAGYIGPGPRKLNNAYHSAGSSLALLENCQTRPDVDIKSKSWISGGVSVDTECFSVKEPMREWDLRMCCSALYTFWLCMCVSISEFYEICMKHIWTPTPWPPPSTPPLPYRPGARSFKPTQAQMSTSVRANTHLRTNARRYNVAPWPPTNECVSFRDHNNHREWYTVEENRCRKQEKWQHKTKPQINSAKRNVCRAWNWIGG